MKLSKRLQQQNQHGPRKSNEKKQKTYSIKVTEILKMNFTNIFLLLGNDDDVEYNILPIL